MKIGFTCSCFDLFHAGHIMMLKEAKSICDYLIVGLQTDPTIDRPEKNKPIQSVFERFDYLLASSGLSLIWKRGFHISRPPRDGLVQQLANSDTHS